MKRLHLFSCLFLATCLLGLSGFPVAWAEEKTHVNPINQNWAAQVKKKREAAREAAEKEGKQPGSPPGAPTGGTAIIDGKRIRVRARPTATPTTAPASASPQVSSSTPTAASTTATATPTATLTSIPTVTPTPIIVKRPKVVDGKIIMVDVEVTPTPVAAQSVADATLAQASQTAKKVISATGIMGEIRDQLTKAILSASKTITLPPKYFPRIREEVMAATTKRKDQLKGVLSASQTTQLQIEVSRLSGNTKGIPLKATLATNILKALWPKEAAVLLSKLKVKPKQDSDSEPTAQEDDLFIEEDTEAISAEREIYIDPNTGAYVYEDGTPVPVAPAAPARPPVAPPPPPPSAFQDNYYQPPPPPPPPPPQYEEYPEEDYVEYEDGENYEEMGDDQYIEEDPSLYEEPQQDDYIDENLDYNEEDFQNIDGEIQDYGDEGYIDGGEI